MKYQLTIVRSRWANPSYDNALQDHGESQLLNDRDCMCCLGFAMEKAGFPRDAIHDTATPEGLPRELYDGLPPAAREFAKLFVVETEVEHDDGYGTALNSYPALGDTGFTRDAIHINDASHLSLGEREEKLTALFAEHDVALVFVD